MVPNKNQASQKILFSTEQQTRSNRSFQTYLYGKLQPAGYQYVVLSMQWHL